jgi:hypothetical protein
LNRYNPAPGTLDSGNSAPSHDRKETLTVPDATSTPSTNDPATPPTNDPAKIAGHFYIMSKIGLSDWALSARPNGTRLQITRAAFRPEQLWTRIESQGGGSFHLINAANNKALKQSGFKSELELVEFNRGDSSQKWVSRQWGDWFGIAALNDVQQLINVAGSSWNENNAIVLWEFSRGDFNESWKAVNDFGAFALHDIKYDLDRLVADFNLPPVNCVAEEVNTMDSDLGSRDTLELQRQFSTSTRFTYSQSSSTMLSIMVKLGAKFIWKDALEVTQEARFTRQVSETVTFGEERAFVETTSDKVTHAVDVPARRRVKFWVVVKSGKINVPYTATIRRTDGPKTHDITVTGQYERVNATSYEIMQRDVVTGEQKVVKAAPVRATAAGA